MVLVRQGIGPKGTKLLGIKAVTKVLKESTDQFNRYGCTTT